MRAGKGSVGLEVTRDLGGEGICYRADSACTALQVVDRVLRTGPLLSSYYRADITNQFPLIPPNGVTDKARFLLFICFLSWGLSPGSFV